MNLNRNISSFHVNAYLLAISTVFANSCVPEAGQHSPSEYELEISISSDKTPAISQDGNLIAYYHECLENPEPEGYPTGLYLMNSDGTNRRLVLKGRHWSPSWSPDGNWLAFTSDGTLRIINFEGDSIRTFHGMQDLLLYSPDWSGDGKEILFSAPMTLNGGVFRMSPDFLSIKRILNPQTNNGMYASWSPDRSKIVYQKGNQSWESVEIFITDTALVSEKRLTDDNKDDRHAAWSSDGNMITWSSNVLIKVMNIDGTNQKMLDYGQYPCWTPDSKYIIYSNANLDVTKEVIWRINIDGKNKTQLTF